MLHAGSWDKPGLKNDLVSVNSAWLELFASSDSGYINLYWADRLYGHTLLIVMVPILSCTDDLSAGVTGKTNASRA